MKEYEIGDEVRNIKSGWNSNCCEYSTNRETIGLIGTITKKKYCDGAFLMAYEIHWDKGGFCGKDHSQIELFKKRIQNYEIY